MLCGTLTWGVSADDLEFGRGAGSRETRHSVLFCPMGVSWSSHACVYNHGKQFLISPELARWPHLWHLRRSCGGRRLTEPGLGCTARPEPVGQHPCVCARRLGSWATQAASPSPWGSSTSSGLWVEPMCLAASAVLLSMAVMSSYLLVLCGVLL